MYFQIIGPWTKPDRMKPPGQAGSRGVPLWYILGVMLPAVVTAALLARRNFRLGRGDRRGAWRLAVFIMGLALLDWVCATNHVPGVGENGSLVWGVSLALFYAAVFWVLYMALEPYVRRRWPQSLVSWSRLLANGVSDALVGGHLLIGITVGVGMALFFLVEDLVSLRYGPTGFGSNLGSLLDARRMIDELDRDLIASIGAALGLFLLFFVLRALLRRTWLAAVVLGIVFSAFMSSVRGHASISLPFAFLQFGLTILILVKFGVLPMAATVFVSTLPARFLLTADFSAWFARSTIFVLLVVLAAAAYSFWIALARRPLLNPGFLED